LRPRCATSSLPDFAAQRLLERRTAGNRFRIVLGESTDDADAPHPLRLLRARRERPRCGRAAKQRDELATPDARCHLTPLAEG
jgi:hypothetical protein